MPSPSTPPKPRVRAAFVPAILGLATLAAAYFAQLLSGMAVFVFMVLYLATLISAAAGFVRAMVRHRYTVWSVVDALLVVALVGAAIYYAHLLEAAGV